MGRVHKKKIAEYAESAENENDQDEETKKSATVESNSDESDGEGTAGDAGEEGGAEEVKKKSIGSVTDEDQPQEEGSSGTGGGAKKANKRKAAPEKLADGDGNDVDSDDEPLNGGGAGSAKKGRKAATGGKQKAAGKNGKAGGKRGKGKKAPAKTAVEEEEGGEEVYEVKDIVGHKVEHGMTYYLIRWKGYTKDDDTWEPEDTLSCPDIIEKYNNKKPASKTDKKSATVTKKGVRAAKGTSGVDPNKEWEVDKIIDYAEEKNQRVFRIRWKGFGPKHDTWEPEVNLSCDEIIDKFMKRMKSQENVSFKELREEPKKTKRLVNESLPRTNYSNPIGRKSKRAVSKKRVYYGDSDE
ncbi:M-phase phosphoprotein 8 [Eurosta solidaginis]|uniref:M-phase phosphoprotein 8 n=1 Tax=Eurosta solidaginis TaxID=178769 RepID=UPI0035316082